MAKCKNCINLNNHWCDIVADSPDEDIERNCCIYEKMTKADRIRSMSDEELAEFLDIVEQDGIQSQYKGVPCDCCIEKTECASCWKEWLQSEVEE